jgi:transcriptional regulator GlxA family with amidase domain
MTRIYPPPRLRGKTFQWLSNGRNSGVFDIADKSTHCYALQRGTMMIREVAILAPPKVQPLDVVGPFEVFSNTALALKSLGHSSGGYRVNLLSTTQANAIQGMNGLILVAESCYRKHRKPIDTFVIAGGAGVDAAIADPLLISWVRATSKRVRRMASVCTGAFVLAEAGLLDGRRATTHWHWCEKLARRYPKITVESNSIYVKDGQIWTSAGVTAGMDLALAMVEEDFGATVALAVARGLVLYLRRAGGQDQHSVALEYQRSSRQDLRELTAWAVDHLDQDLSVEALARRASMSTRNFARVFAREQGITPALWVQKLRVESARQRLEQRLDGIDAVAAQCGFSSSELMRRAFLRILKVNPSSYRARFCRKAAN